MKKIFKKFALSLALMMFGVLLLNTHNASAESLSTGLVKLDYTIDEIRQMSLGEYYSKIFPETFDEFTTEQKEELFNTPYPNVNSKVSLGLGVGYSSLWKSSTNVLGWGVSTTMDLGSDTAKKLYHSSVLTDSNGTTWMIRNEGKTDANYFYMGGYKDVVSGQYRLETVHTVNWPSGYFPSTSSAVSASSWVYSY